jgi:hypothetical protein
MHLFWLFWYISFFVLAVYALVAFTRTDDHIPRWSWIIQGVCALVQGAAILHWFGWL